MTSDPKSLGGGPCPPPEEKVNLAPAALAPEESGKSGHAPLPEGIDALRAERDKLAAFKAYVHKRLDDAGVPVDPPGEHRDAGCRIGQRLDYMLVQMDAIARVAAAYEINGGPSPRAAALVAPEGFVPDAEAAMHRYRESWIAARHVVFAAREVCSAWPADMEFGMPGTSIGNLRLRVMAYDQRNHEGGSHDQSGIRPAPPEGFRALRTECDRMNAILAAIYAQTECDCVERVDAEQAGDGSWHGAASRCVHCLATPPYTYPQAQVGIPPSSASPPPSPEGLSALQANNDAMHAWMEKAQIAEAERDALRAERDRAQAGWDGASRMLKQSEKDLADCRHVWNEAEQEAAALTAKLAAAQAEARHIRSAAGDYAAFKPADGGRERHAAHAALVAALSPGDAGEAGEA